VVRALPALHALRDRHPHAQIDWAVEPKSADVLTGHPCLDQVLVFERSQDWRGTLAAFRRFCAQLRANRYDIAIDFHGLLKSGLMLRATKAKERYAFAAPRAQEFSHFFANHTVQLLSQRMNRIEENLELCKVLDARSHALDVSIDVPDDAQEQVDAYFEDTFHSAKRHVLIHVPVDREEKQWPLEHFAALSDLLMADGRFEVLFTWGPGQLPIVERTANMCLRPPFIAPETPELKHFAWLAWRSDIFFGGDTGPMHIASAMGTPVVAVFGGTDPAKHAPLRHPSTVLYKGPEPFPKRVELREAKMYLAAITPEIAYDACIRLLKQ
jgi:ADP-heptose:LPS heptosyltransferase